VLICTASLFCALVLIFTVSLCISVQLRCLVSLRPGLLSRELEAANANSQNLVALGCCRLRLRELVLGK